MKQRKEDNRGSGFIAAGAVLGGAGVAGAGEKLGMAIQNESLRQIRKTVAGKSSYNPKTNEYKWDSAGYKAEQQKIAKFSQKIAPYLKKYKTDINFSPSGRGLGMAVPRRGKRTTIFVASSNPAAILHELGHGAQHATDWKGPVGTFRQKRTEMANRVHNKIAPFMLRNNRPMLLGKIYKVLAGPVRSNRIRQDILATEADAWRRAYKMAGEIDPKLKKGIIKAAIPAMASYASIPIYKATKVGLIAGGLGLIGMGSYKLITKDRSPKTPRASRTPQKRPKRMDRGDIRFVRIRGRVVPIRKKRGADKIA